MQSNSGLLIIVVGLAIVLVGIVAYLGGLSWFGNLPGDIKIKGESYSIYIPIVSTLLISLVLSLISYFVFVRRFF